jgi:hypothetical protein
MKKSFLLMSGILSFLFLVSSFIVNAFVISAPYLYSPSLYVYFIGFLLAVITLVFSIRQFKKKEFSYIGVILSLIVIILSAIIFPVMTAVIKQSAGGIRFR